MKNQHWQCLINKDDKFKEVFKEGELGVSETRDIQTNEELVDEGI